MCRQDPGTTFQPNPNLTCGNVTGGGWWQLPYRRLSGEFIPAEGSGSQCGGGEVDFLEDRVECLGLAGEVIGGVGAEPADVAAQVR